MSREPTLVTHRVTAYEYLTVRRMRERQGFERIQLIGEIDLVTAPLLRNALADTDSNETTSVLVDLSRVEFLALAGVHVFRDATERKASAHRRLLLASPTPTVQRTLTLTDAARYLEIYLSTPFALSTLTD